jgi:hypothetical protein
MKEAKTPYLDFLGGLARKLKDYKCPLAHLMRGIDPKYIFELARDIEKFVALRTVV